MRKEGIVLNTEGRQAVVSVIREGACGGNCSKCGSCESKAMKVEVKNSVGAKGGDRVLLESDTLKIMLLAFLFYILPILVFFAVYFIMDHIGSTKTAVVISEFAVLLAYAVGMKLLGKKLKIDIKISKIL